MGTVETRTTHTQEHQNMNPTRNELLEILSTYEGMIRQGWEQGRDVSSLLARWTELKAKLAGGQ
jgi:hypothetical protein